MVVELWEVGRANLGLAGGKGANLGELIRAGFPVPPGFVVTTAAYEQFVAHNQLGEAIGDALEKGELRLVRTAFERASVPPKIAREILWAYERLEDGPVAVRSSGTAEDLPEAAFAGQHDTFLNVIGGEALLEAIRACWTSLWTDRAVAYRDRLGIDHWTARMAVVVQRLVPAAFAGVMFTTNPVTGAREVVIEASPGLGEAVVAGLVTPDHFVLRPRWLGQWGWRVAERRPGGREVIIRPKPGGGTEEVSEAAPAAILPDGVLYRLAELEKAVEAHFGRPQDIEWAWAEGKIYILQARPLTALPDPLPRPAGPVAHWARLVAELLPGRPYPLESTTWVAAIFGGLTEAAELAGLDPRPLDEVFVVEDGVVVRLRNRFPLRISPRVLWAPFRLLGLARRHDLASWHQDPQLAEAVQCARALETLDLKSLTWAGLIWTAREALAIPALVWRVRLRYAIPALVALGLLRLWLSLLGYGRLFGTLAFAGVEIKILEMGRALEALAARVRGNPELADVFARHEPGDLWHALESFPAGRAFLAELKAFLDEYGHRETGGSLQVVPSTWKDRPEVVLGIVKALTRTGGAAPARQPDWKAARDRVLAHPSFRIPGLRRAFLRLLDQARLFQQVREDTRFYMMFPLPPLRRVLLELGRRLAEARVLLAAEDVFHLTFSELEGLDSWPPAPELAARLRQIVLRRKARRAGLEAIPLVDPRLLGREEPTGDVLVRGIPGSPGVAEGLVCVIRDPAEFGKLRPGDVLVAPYTNPAWTPLFGRASAVVVESGGPASHAAIVAREYGIPAVMGAREATWRLADGRRVRVDGSRGLVLRAD